MTDFENYLTKLNDVNVTPQTDISIQAALSKVGWPTPTSPID